MASYSPYLTQTYKSISDRLLEIKGKYLKGSAWWYVNIYNEHVVEEVMDAKQNNSYSFNFPACFVEIVKGKSTQGMGGLLMYPECEMRLHLLGTRLNDSDLMERNIDIFGLRDLIIRKFSNLSIANFSQVQLIDDIEDFGHNNVYELVLAYKTNFTDRTGSIYDEFSGKEVGTIENPTINMVFEGLSYGTEDLTGVFVDKDNKIYKVQ